MLSQNRFGRGRSVLIITSASGATRRRAVVGVAVRGRGHVGAGVHVGAVQGEVQDFVGHFVADDLDAFTGEEADLETSFSSPPY